jgi:hypothetical protein
LPTVFVSHSSRDRDFVENDLLPLLHRYSINAWYSKEAIPSASVWEKTIRQGLNSCEWFLVVLSPAAIQSEWVQTEVHWAIEHRKERIVPVLIRDCDPSDLHLQLIRYQYVNFLRDRDEAHKKLLAIWSVRIDQQLSMELHIHIKSFSPNARSKEQEQRIVIHEFGSIGKSPDCEVFLKDDPAISRKHAALRVREKAGMKSLWLFDMSTNGTKINGEYVKEKSIEPGDIITAGDTAITVLSIEVSR